MAKRKRNKSLKFFKNAAVLSTAAFFLAVAPSAMADLSLSLKSLNPSVEKRATETLYDFKGLRLAAFGMDQDAVIKALRDDFGLEERDLKKSIHSFSKTPIITTPAVPLIEGLPPVAIDYVFGFESGALMQINLDWHVSEQEGLSKETLYAIGGNLQKFYLGQNFDPGKIETAVPISKDQLILLRAEDVDGNMILLLMEGLEKRQDSLEETPLSLTLSFQKDPDNPDIFKAQ